MSKLNASWNRAWTGIGAAGDGESVRSDLLTRYSEPQRKYHTVQHLQECIQAFDVVRELPPHGHEVGIALWFHDSIYDPLRHDNEQRSADMAVSTLQGAGVRQEVADRVRRLILATQHAVSPIDLDEQIMIDVDLSILGSNPERFAEYELQVRQEYAFVPEAVFWSKRRQILQGQANLWSRAWAQAVRDMTTEPLQEASTAPTPESEAQHQAAAVARPAARTDDSPRLN
jgi:predicted metal-dependent HD superfamily phosphohydrolase